MSSTGARENILARLYRSTEKKGYAPGPEPWEPAPLEREARIETFVELMRAVRSEVYRVKGDGWVERLKEILADRGVGTLVYGPDTDIGRQLEKAWEKQAVPTELVPWKDTAIEEFQDRLFGMDAGITSTMGGIAEAAALILWPTPEEPRLLSLVPPIHFAVVRAEKIFTSFPEAIRELNWAEKAPTNGLLISGPSKTADIELILQFGVHGPTDLIVFVVD